jgi:DNA modification methylase
MGIESYIDKVHCMDIFELMKELPDASCDMVWAEPDYSIGYSYGANRDKNYTMAFDKYIQWYCNLAKESLRVLKPTGNFFALNYPKQNAYLQVKFMEDNFHAVHEYVWVTGSSLRKSPYHFTIAHRSILHGRKSAESVWYKDQVAYKSKYKKDGKYTMAMPLSWIFQNVVSGFSKEKTMHACQIPVKLFELFINASTKKEDLVLIHFAGSGGEVCTAQHLGRHYITTDLDPDYVAMVQDRLKKGFIEDKYKLKTNLKQGFKFHDDAPEGKTCPDCGTPIEEEEDKCNDCAERTIIEAYKGES